MPFTETGHPKLSELYPNVSRVTLFVAFEEADADAEPNYQQIIFTGNAATVFRLGCSRDDCVDGGFDYGPPIADLIQRGEEREHGKIACEGRLGSGRRSKPCSLQSEYRIIVQYRH